MKKLSPRMTNLLQKLHAGGANNKVHWLGGIDAHAFVSGTLQTVTTTVMALMDRGLVVVVFDNGSLMNGTVELTKRGVTIMENQQ